MTPVTTWVPTTYGAKKFRSRVLAVNPLAAGAMKSFLKSGTIRTNDGIRKELHWMTKDQALQTTHLRSTTRIHITSATCIFEILTMMILRKSFTPLQQLEG